MVITTVVTAIWLSGSGGHGNTGVMLVWFCVLRKSVAFLCCSLMERPGRGFATLARCLHPIRLMLKGFSR